MIRFLNAATRKQIGMTYFDATFAYGRLAKYAETAPDPHEIILVQESQYGSVWELTERLVISDLASAKP